LFPTFLLVLYPVLVHLALAFQQERIAGGLLVLAGLSLAISDIRLRPGLHLIQIPFFGLGLAGLAYLGYPQEERLLFLPPVVMILFLLGLFGVSLRPGRVPLVTQISRLMHGGEDPEVDRYTRQVTRMWVIFFALMAVEVVVLALFAPLHVWALFTGALNYLFILGAFLGEYLVRVYRLPNHPHAGLWSFLRALARTDWGNLRF